MEVSLTKSQRASKQFLPKDIPTFESEKFLAGCHFAISPKVRPHLLHISGPLDLFIIQKVPVCNFFCVFEIYFH
jgi:hypothetical protein